MWADIHLWFWMKLDIIELSRTVWKTYDRATQWIHERSVNVPYRHSSKAELFGIAILCISEQIYNHSTLRLRRTIYIGQTSLNSNHRIRLVMYIERKWCIIQCKYYMQLGPKSATLITSTTTVPCKSSYVSITIYAYIVYDYSCPLVFDEWQR